MTQRSLYRPARRALQRVYAALKTQASPLQANLLAIPSPEHLEQMIVEGFWASLDHEEHRPVRFTLEYLHHIGGYSCIPLQHGVDLTAKKIRSLCPVLRPDASLLVHGSAGLSLVIYGIGTEASLGTQVSTLDTGRIAVRCNRTTVAVLDHRVRHVHSRAHLRLKKTIERCIGPAALPAPFANVAVVLDPAEQAEVASALRRMLAAVRALRHGGTIIIGTLGPKSVTPSHPTHPFWAAAEGVLEKAREVEKARVEACTALLRDERAITEDEKRLICGAGSKHQRERYETLLEQMAWLTAIDGAVVLDPRLRVVAFGVEIDIKSDHDDDVLVLEVDPFGSKRTEKTIRDTGGTRHRSAARLAFAERTCGVFVVSSDGSISLFTRSPTKEAVVWQRHLEVLL